MELTPSFRLTSPAQNADHFQMKSVYEMGGYRGARHRLSAPSRRSTGCRVCRVNVHTLCTPRRTGALNANARRRTESTHRVWNRLHLRRTLECAPLVWGAGRNNEQHSRKQHSTFKQHFNKSTVDITHQIVGEIRQFPARSPTFASRARFIFSRRLVRRNSDSRRRVRGVGDLPWYSIVFGRSNARRATS